MMSLLAGLASVLSGLEVAYEHYRGSYSQRIMYSPIILSPLLLGAGIAGAVNRRAAQTILPLVSLTIVLDGVIGFAFHVRGVHRKPGGWRVAVADMIMGPPVFAPLLFALSGYMGLLATFLRRADDPALQMPMFFRRTWGNDLVSAVPQSITAVAWEVRMGRFQQQLAAVAALSALFSGAEALYSHYKNNFRDRIEWTPIVLTPAMLIAGLGAVWKPAVARTLLPAVSVLALLDGLVGTVFHVRGVLRRPGGLTMSFYNVMYGPPIFAPMLFSASGFMGLLASRLGRSG